MEEEERWDAIIVGAGPAGSTLAWRMVQAGWKPLILDKAVFPREKLCAGWITPPVVEALELDTVAYARQYTFQEFTGFRASRFSTEPVTAAYDRPISFGILRKEFDHYLLQRCGAESRLGCRVRTIERTSGGWTINGRFQAPLLVGAGGHFCPVARFLGADLKSEKKLSTLELEFEPQDPSVYAVDPKVPELIYFDDIRGYGWIFRKGNFINIGIGRTRNRHLWRHLRDFLKTASDRGLISRASLSDLSGFRGHPYKLHFVTPRRCLDEGVLLLGDAAGLTFNYSGEGIRPAVESALLAWNVVRQARGDYSAHRLKGYQEALYHQYGKPVTGWRLQFMESLPPACFQTLGRLVFSSSTLIRRLFVERLFLRRQDYRELPG